MLAPRRRIEIEEYLSHRPWEAARVRDFQAQNRGFHELFDRYLAAPLPREIELLEHHFVRFLRRRARIRRYGRRAAAAATVVVAFGLGGFVGTRYLPTPGGLFSVFLPITPAETAASQEGGGLKPVRIDMDTRTGISSGDRSGRAMPDLSPFGLKLVSTRLLPSDRETVQLVFESDSGRRVMLYLAAQGHDGKRHVSLNREGPLSVLSWSDKGRSYNLIGEIDRDTILAIGRAINGDALGTKGIEASPPQSQSTDRMRASSARDAERRAISPTRP